MTTLESAFAGIPANREQLLRPLAERLLSAKTAARWVRSPLEVVPHRKLRLAMLQDPILDALLAVSPVIFTTDALVLVGYEFGTGAIVRLAPDLLDEPGALAVVARAAIERYSADQAPPSIRAQARAAADRHAALLAGRLSAEERRLAGLALEPDSTIGGDLALPLENLLVTGGDNRLQVDPDSGMNRYGTTPGPRPDAIQFSSSTASSISETAFWFTELVRSAALVEMLESEVSSASIRERLADAVRSEILGLLGLDTQTADAILCASGTDSELLAVLLALAAGDAPITNILIAPEESGRGVLIAGEGRYFDSLTQTGDTVGKGDAAWPERAIDIALVSIRDDAGNDRPPAAMAAEVRELTQRALERGHHVILHQLLASKTGLSAPDFETLDDVRSLAPERIDVVVDACQMRISPKLLGDLVRRGWLVQISGSKAFTGPPFSGALVVPASLRSRATAVGALMTAAPAVTGASDWPPSWRSRLPAETGCPAFGPLFRWLAALVEATLVEALPIAGCRLAYDRFREVLEARIRHSAYLVPLADRDNELVRWDATTLNFAGRSIISFALADPADSRPKEAADCLPFDDCQRLFEMLNSDLSGLIEGLGAHDRALLASPAHIGQPVALRPGAPSVLRLVIGARFFTIVGFGPRGSEEAALISEIGDAVRAIEKLELLLRHWPRLRAVVRKP